MYQIAQLLEIPGGTEGLPAYSNNLRTGRTPRPLFTTINRVPGFAAALRRDSMPSGSVSRSQMTANRSAERYILGRSGWVIIRFIEIFFVVQQVEQQGRQLHLENHRKADQIHLNQEMEVLECQDQGKAIFAYITAMN